MENNDGSLFKVPLTKILAINPHGNAERLEVATVYGFQVIVRKDTYKVGDEVIYIPIDSNLPQWLEARVFPSTKDENGNIVPPKIKLNNSRVRQIKIRGLASQGMLINPKEFIIPERVKVEDDLSELFGVTKYEPPVSGPSSTIGKDKQRNKKYEHALFHRYNGISALKWFPNIFDDQEVVIQCKLHGTNARAAILPFQTNNLWKKFLKFVGLAPEYEKCYGSNNVEISAKPTKYKGFYEEDLYGKAFKSIDVFSKIKPGEIVFGEIVGEGIQKNYTYGHTDPHFVLFDVKELQPDGKFKWMNPDEVELYAKSRGFDFVPVLYKGIYDKEKAYALTFGPSVYCPSQKVREGIVIKSKYDYDNLGNKRAFKLISEDYLSDKNNSDNH